MQFVKGPTHNKFVTDLIMIRGRGPWSLRLKPETDFVVTVLERDPELKKVIKLWRNNNPSFKIIQLTISRKMT